MCTSVILLGFVVSAAPSIGSADHLRIEDVQVKLIDEVRVPARESGVLAELSVREQHLVQTGDVLGRLDSELAIIDEKLAKFEHEIARIQSENEVDRLYAEKSLAVAESELTRSQDSVEVYAGSVSRTELERLQLVVDKARLSIEQSTRDLQIAGLTTRTKELAVQAAAKHVELRRIVAPIDGMVVEVFRKPGEWLDTGEAVIRIIKMDPLRVEAFVDGQKHGADLSGRPVRLTTHLPPDGRAADFPGRVVFVSPEVEPVTGQIRVWADVENRDLQLRPGTRGVLTIDLSPSN